MTTAPNAPPAAIRDLLTLMLEGRTMSRAQSAGVFEDLFQGTLDDAQIAALLTLIQTRGATIDELTGAAEAMRRHVAVIPVVDSDVAPIIDTCGTGGAPKAFNISTCAAIVAAAAAPGKLRVAKHGNKSRTGRGSAEVLAALGVNVDAPPDVQARCLDQTGVCFCFAVHHHPAVRHAMTARRSLGFPTIFNLLGPLTNPAGAKRQLIGVYKESLVEPMAATLARLGVVRAMVVHGLDGLDEVTITAPTRVAFIERGQVRVDTIHPDRFRIQRSTLEQLRVGSLDAAARLFTAILDGQPGPGRDVVLINAAAAVFIAGASPDLGTAVELCRTALDDGRARETLRQLIEVSQSRA